MTSQGEGKALFPQSARILLVEDDDVLRSVIERNLRARGHEVSIAEDAQAALTQLRTHVFDLIILDINLPDKTGWDVLRIAQQEDHVQRQKLDAANNADSADKTDWKLPVVVLSAVRISSQKLIEFRPLAYLPKPFPLDALLRLAFEAATRRKGTVLTPFDTEDDNQPLPSSQEKQHA